MDGLIYNKPFAKVDYSQIVQLECLCRGIWGIKSLWGPVLTHKY